MVILVVAVTVSVAGVVLGQGLFPQAGYVIGFITGEVFMTLVFLTNEWRKGWTEGVPKELTGPLQCGNCDTLLPDIKAMVMHGMQTGHHHFRNYGDKKVAP